MPNPAKIYFWFTILLILTQKKNYERKNEH